MKRNFLKGRSGDRVNVKMAAPGYNFARWIPWFADLLCEIFHAILAGLFQHPFEKTAS